MTKNDEPHVFLFTAELRQVLESQRTAHERLKADGILCPWVFFRLVGGRRGRATPKPITAIDKAWKAACRAAGCPGRIPHDFRRTAVRNLVRAGMPEKTTMQLTGHLTRSVFERYNIVSEADLFTAAARLDAFAVPDDMRQHDHDDTCPDTRAWTIHGQLWVPEIPHGALLHLQRMKEG
jgi:integrase